MLVAASILGCCTSTWLTAARECREMPPPSFTSTEMLYLPFRVYVDTSESDVPVVACSTTEVRFEYAELALWFAHRNQARLLMRADDAAIPLACRLSGDLRVETGPTPRLGARYTTYSALRQRQQGRPGLARGRRMAEA